MLLKCTKYAPLPIKGRCNAPIMSAHSWLATEGTGTNGTRSTDKCVLTSDAAKFYYFFSSLVSVSGYVDLRAAFRIYQPDK